MKSSSFWNWDTMTSSTWTTSPFFFVFLYTPLIISAGIAYLQATCTSTKITSNKGLFNRHTITWHYYSTDTVYSGSCVGSNFCGRLVFNIFMLQLDFTDAHNHAHYKLHYLMGLVLEASRLSTKNRPHENFPYGDNIRVAIPYTWALNSSPLITFYKGE